jgi:hypothetical protein
MGGEIIDRHAASRLLQDLNDGFGDLALVERSLSSFSYDFEGARQSWITKDFTG